MKTSRRRGRSTAALPEASVPLSQVPPSPYCAFIGIDWGDQKHAFSLRESGANLRVVREGTFTMKEIPDWVCELRQKYTHGRVIVAMENHRGTLLYALAQHADFMDLVLVPTSSAAEYRKAFRPSGAKADAPDAESLLDMLYHHQERLEIWQPDDEATRMLATLCQIRRDTVNERTRLGNHLTARLKLAYPVALEVCGDVTSNLALSLLQRWPTMAQLKTARPETLRQFFYQQHIRLSKQVEKRLEQIAKASALVKDPAVLVPLELDIKRLVSEIKTLLPAIEDYDKRIARLYASHPDAAIFKSLPGAGPALGPRLLCALGSQRERWPSALELQTYSGLSPVCISSGKMSSVQMRRACPKYLRQTFHEFANSSIRYCQWARDYYEKLRARGNQHHTALRSLAWRWVRILWRIWQDQTVYDEAVCMGQRRRYQLGAKAAVT